MELNDAFKSRHLSLFHNIQTDFWATRPTIQWAMEGHCTRISLDKSDLIMKLATLFRLVSTLRMRGAISSLLHTSSRRDA
jgi:hypothetical protein